ncbi:uncharacterized protein HD556DRAFT_1443435 [Suillus plorans]|uniref:Ribonuclease H1 N-terminal domain-containing protein n=1 Tax=Suillus plorans TaxID=116603 RepID=A0A9P7APE3_9AGAM|nr:uncharacterized protein HD556DRAFT_1443435 [Suillus plorans]KAG1793644.1 hypothetical protein HD556DRAFT_1443435 [Suillus plorans]
MGGAGNNYWVVLGGPNPGIFREQPFTAQLNGAHYFPIAIHCRWDEYAQKLNQFQTLLKDINEFTPPPDAARLFLNSDMAQGVLRRDLQCHAIQGFYVVIYGFTPGIYTTWEDCHGAVSGYNNAKYKKLTTFAEAMSWMILKGKKLNEEEPVCTTRAAVLNSSESGFKPSSTSHGTETTRSAALQARLIFDSKSSSHRQSSASLGANLMVTPKAPHTWRTMTPGSVSHAISASPCVHQFIRELSGITGAHYQASPHDDTPLPSFGDMADGYLQSHGYTARAVLCIAHAVEVSQSGEDFVRDISGRGLSVTEARWLWQIITGDNTF